MRNKKPAPEILLVDDDPQIRDLLGSELERMGHSVTTRSSGFEMLSELREREFDVILLDINMPEMSGMDVLKSVKDLGSLSEVVILTGHGTIDRAIEAMKLGAYDFLTKPCELARLEVVLQKAYEKKIMHTQNLVFRNLVTPGGREPFVGTCSSKKKVI